MADLKRFPDPVWERFFDFVYGCEENLTRTEVQEDLKRLGIDVSKAVSRVQETLASARARAALADARARRPGIISQLREVAAPAAGALRDHLRGLIEGKFRGTAQAAYFRKLESAATDEDLESLLEDIHRLESLPGGQDDEDPTAK
jgi:hypothetical protein